MATKTVAETVWNTDAGTSNVTNVSQGRGSEALQLHSSDHPGMIFVSTPLDGKNFLAWSRGVRRALEAKKLGFITSTCKRPVGDSKLIEQWTRADSMVVTWLLNAMNKNITNAFIYTKSARVLWITLNERYNFLMGLNDEYDGVRSQILVSKPLLNINKAYQMILRVERQHQLNVNGSSAGLSVPSTNFFGNSLKKVNSRSNNSKISSRSFKVVAEVDEKKQTDQDRWKGLVTDISDDQQDITRGKGMVDTLFQAPMGAGTHDPVLSSYEYLSAGLRQYEFDNNMDGYYIAPAFMDKLVVHIAKNFMNLPNIKVPLILGIWGGKGQGKSFQCELVFAKLGINPIMMSAGELESGNAGEPAKLIRQRYREAADRIAKGKMCVLFINDLDAGAGRLGGTTQYTVNNQMVNATLMNIADNPTNVQLPGMYNKQENPRVPIIVTGNDFSTLYAPLIRDGRMEKFYWAPTREDRIGVCTGIFRTDNVPKEEIVKLVDTFPGQSIDFFGALRARVYDDEVRKWIASVGVENIGKKLVNSREKLPEFEQPKMTLAKLLEYGNMLVQEQENVKRVQLSDKYLKEAALGDANEDAIKNGSFYGKAAQQVPVPVPEGCTDPNAENFDPTARSDDGSCVYS
ncbi:UNVERIFIED_CONTAM: Ribulose bisphosphate carboxylase/oxygenase activase 1, chloroplastic [Sesamum latifolium]|uniref:Ribulose bisphosphate carboxylase/oxygenase activase, chloroplastic n=2 Tax=Sesamum TaxID=4181 RepID=A0AAW2XG21_9LAMI